MDAARQRFALGRLDHSTRVCCHFGVGGIRAADSNKILRLPDARQVEHLPLRSVADQQNGVLFAARRDPVIRVVLLDHHDRIAARPEGFDQQQALVAQATDHDMIP